MNRELHTLFPVPVMIYKRFNEVDQELKTATELEMQDSLHNQTSIVFKALDLPEFATLKSFCLEAINDYTKTVLNTTQALRITTSWITKTVSDGKHHRHNHKNSIISGVYYWKKTLNSPIIFENPNNDLNNFDLETRQFNNLNSPQHSLSVDDQCLILFPSWLYHKVDSCNEDRYSLAFNTFFEKDGFYGSKKYLTQVAT